MKITALPASVVAALRHGGVIPAHPLALDDNRQLDEQRQRVLSRYYLDAGAIGLAVGVHTTQFEIRQHGLLEPVLALAAEEATTHPSEPFLVAGAIGDTPQALQEAKLAANQGYHAVLLGLAGLSHFDENALIDHCCEIADVMPLIGFYLQEAVGGPALPYSFWRRFAAIDNVLAIKIAPFNRYRTIDVVRAVIDAYAENRITLYTGNDDHIIADLLTRFTFMRNGEPISIRIKGGLLGHWAVWTRKAVALVNEIHAQPANLTVLDWLERDARITEANAAIFDAANGFTGCIAGIHEILRRQGLLRGTWCLDPAQSLGPGQAQEIDRIYRDYPELADDDFVRAHLNCWQKAVD